MARSFRNNFTGKSPMTLSRNVKTPGAELMIRFIFDVTRALCLIFKVLRDAFSTSDFGSVHSKYPYEQVK